MLFLISFLNQLFILTDSEEMAIAFILVRFSLWENGGQTGETLISRFAGST